MFGPASFLRSLNLPKAASRVTHQITVSYYRKADYVEAGVPTKPKKPLTPYYRFFKTQQKEIFANNPKIEGRLVVQAVAKLWKNVAPETLDQLNREYLAEKLAYDKAIVDLAITITPEQKLMMAQARDARRRAESARKKRARNKELNKPHKPASAFMMFLREKSSQQSSLPSGPRYKTFVGQMGVEWKNLPEDEKQSYVEAHRKALEQYQEKLTVWETEMIKQGHLDVVRKPLVPNKTLTSTAKKSKKNS